MHAADVLIHGLASPIFDDFVGASLLLFSETPSTALCSQLNNGISLHVNGRTSSADNAAVKASHTTESISPHKALPTQCQELDPAGGVSGSFPGVCELLTRISTDLSDVFSDMSEVTSHKAAVILAVECGTPWSKRQKDREEETEGSESTSEAGTMWREKTWTVTKNVDQMIKRLGITKLEINSADSVFVRLSRQHDNVRDVLHFLVSSCCILEGFLYKLERQKQPALSSNSKPRTEPRSTFFPFLYSYLPCAGLSIVIYLAWAWEWWPYTSIIKLWALNFEYLNRHLTKICLLQIYESDFHVSQLSDDVCQQFEIFLLYQKASKARITQYQICKVTDVCTTQRKVKDVF